MTSFPITSLTKIILIFIVPITLVFFGIVTPRYSLWLLAVVSLVVLTLVIFERWPLKKLGIRTDNLRRGWVLYLVFTTLGLVVIIAYAGLLGRHPVSDWRNDYHFEFLFLPVSFLQEFLYRSFLMEELKKIMSAPILVILTNALLFTLLHVIYPDLRAALPLALAGGIGFAALYYYYPNLWLVSLSHSILNFATVLFGFFYRIS